jgi:fructose-1,6-bisphosphatase/inositol monophosphatase family enzyme
VATKHTRDGSSAELEELLEFADRLARAAGAIALSHFGKDISRERKPDGTIVTVADREAEQHMRRCIAERYPSDGIVGEEFGIRQGVSNRRWIIDPIDGTFSYARGVPLFGVLVGVEISGTPSVGGAGATATGTFSWRRGALRSHWIRS